MKQKHYYHRKEKNHLMMTWKEIVSDKKYDFSPGFLCLALCCPFDSMDAGIFLYGKE